MSNYIEKRVDVTRWKILYTKYKTQEEKSIRISKNFKLAYFQRKYASSSGETKVNEENTNINIKL